LRFTHGSIFKLTRPIPSVSRTVHRRFCDIGDPSARRVHVRSQLASSITCDRCSLGLDLVDVA